MREPQRTRRVRLPAEATAPRRARDFVAAACAAWHAERLAETAALMLSELVSNAVLYAGTELDVELRLGGGRLTMSVHDGSDGLPRPGAAAAGSIGGHGLEIVSRLADAWGVAPDPAGGKTVWCTLRADRA